MTEKPYEVIAVLQQRVTALQQTMNMEVERRRQAERELRRLREHVCSIALGETVTRVEVSTTKQS